MKKILLTGASSYFGQAIMKAGSLQGVSVEPLLNAQNMKWRFGDKPNLSQIRNSEGLIHAAWDMQVEDPDLSQRINEQGSIELFQNVLAIKKIEIVFISSMSSFDGCRSVYGHSKLRVEEFIIGIGGIIIRPGLIWSDLTAAGTIKKFNNLVKWFPIIPIISNLKNPLHLVNCEELADHIINISKPGKYTIAYSRPYFLIDIMQAIAKRNKKKRLFIPIPVFVLSAVLKTFKFLRLPLFKTDSLVALIYADPHPQINRPTAVDLDSNT